ncbi:MAG: sulfatase-like hydrolase/transferase [Pirellulales bacterium]|nr:sulfatase-like hydrolase/transferase [Pirellulales bacterium]
MKPTAPVLSTLLVTTFLLVSHVAGQNGWAGDDASAGRPNILLIYADDQSYKTISCYGEHPPWVSTPNIDALAKRGVRFHRAYLGAWCMPSRASMLTGRLQHGVQTMRMQGQYPGSVYDPKQCPFVPAQLRRGGYHTAQIGKWHTGVDSGYGRDWDFQIVWNRPANPDNAGNYFFNQVLTVNGESKTVPGYSTDNYTDWAVQYIRGEHRSADQPWYLWLCYGAVHGPTTPAERHLGKLKSNRATLPEDILGPWPNKPAYLNDTAAWVPGPGGRPAMKKRRVPSSNFNVNTAGKSFDDWIQQMNECNMAIDEGVGRLIKTLRETGQLENTLVIYTADQGYGLGEHGFNQKVAPYDATIASPLIISQPGRVAEGRVCPHPVNSPDLVELMCRWAGVEIPWKMHGRDIRPLLADPSGKDWNRPMLMTHTGRSYGADTDVVPSDGRLVDTGKVPWYVLLRDGKYKYVRTLVAGEMEELYDLESDPEELKNLARLPQHRQRVRKLRAEAIEQLKVTGAKFAEAMPDTMALP